MLPTVLCRRQRSIRGVRQKAERNRDCRWQASSSEYQTSPLQSQKLSLFFPLKVADSKSQSIFFRLPTPFYPGSGKGVALIPLRHLSFLVCTAIFRLQNWNWAQPPRLLRQLQVRSQKTTIAWRRHFRRIRFFLTHRKSVFSYHIGLASRLRSNLARRKEISCFNTTVNTQRSVIQLFRDLKENDAFRLPFEWGPRTQTIFLKLGWSRKRGNDSRIWWKPNKVNLFSYCRGANKNQEKKLPWNSFTQSYFLCTCVWNYSPFDIILVTSWWWQCNVFFLLFELLRSKSSRHKNGRSHFWPISIRSAMLSAFYLHSYAAPNFLGLTPPWSGEPIQ